MAFKTQKRRTHKEEIVQLIYVDYILYYDYMT